MKVKIFSVRADESSRAIRIGNETGKLSANKYLEKEVQHFLDENPSIEICQMQFNSTAIVPLMRIGEQPTHLSIGKLKRFLLFCM